MNKNDIDYKHEIINSIHDNHQIFKELSQNLRGDFDISLTAWKTSWDTHPYIHTSLWENLNFILEVLKYEQEQFEKHGDEHAISMGSILSYHPNQIVKADIYKNINLVAEHYDVDWINGVAGTSSEGMAHEYTEAIKAVKAKINNQQ